jgi:hypothetical protein
MRPVGATLETVRESSTADSTAAFEADTAGNYFIGLRGSGADIAYRLLWTAGGSSCTTDAHEPNGSPGSAAELWPSSVISGALCPGDLDFAKLQHVQPGQVVSLELRNRPDQEMILEVWHDGANIIPDQRHEAGLRHAHFRADLPGDYVVLVRGAQPGVSGPYLLAVTEAVAIPCGDDALEVTAAGENDALSSAATLAPGSHAATLCPGDLDVYCVGDYAVGSSISVSITFDATVTNLDAFLFRDNLAGFAQLAKTDSSPEILPTGISQAGSYCVVVLGRRVADAGTYVLEY